MGITNNLAGAQKKDLRVLFFSSNEERLKNKKIIREDKELKDFVHLAYSPLPIVHVTSIPLLRKKGLKFQILKPVELSALTPKERRMLGERKAFVFKPGSLGTFVIRRSPPVFPDELRRSSWE